MGRMVGMVDAGFLAKATAASLGMQITSFDFAGVDVRNWFKYSASVIGQDFLRCYWYDGAYPTESHHAAGQSKRFADLESTPGIQLRLGRLERRSNSQKSAIKRAVVASGGDWEIFQKEFEIRDEMAQKGVDTLMVLDMVRLARDGAFQTVLLIAGDADLSEAAKTVQDSGCEVIVAIPVGAGIAPSLRRTADEVVVIKEMQLRRMLASKAGLQSYIDYPDP